MATKPERPADKPDSASNSGTGETSGSVLGTNLDVDLDGRRVKTGLTGTGTYAAATPPPVQPGAAGLHAKVLTPGPVAQHFITLGRYQLLSRLAVGGMAEVYLARQGELSGFKTLVVVKKVLPHLAMKPDFIAMFLDEARIASMLDHPNVVHITEVGRADNEYFLAMELVQGKPLAAILQQGERAKTPLPHALGALIVANAAAGLHHAHQLTDASGTLLHLVHRDMSPQNIMVSFEGSVKVIDFGIARALGRLGDTNSGSLKGKLGYMAPEQARGENIDARADIFSLGVVLWECIAGRRLFLRENELATLRAVVYEPIPKVSKYAKVDPVLEVIIEHALARDLEERFQTAQEMHVALERWVFAAGGASNHDLATLMKSWFPSDHLQWQRAARLALDMQESDPPIDMAFPDLAAGRALGSKTGTSRPGGSSGSGNRNRPDVVGMNPFSQVVATSSMPAMVAAPSRRGLWFVLILVLLAVAGALGVMFFGPKTQEPLPTVAPTTTPVMRPQVETLPSAGTHEPGVSAGASAAGHRTAEEPEASPTAGGGDGTGTTGKKKNRGTSGERHGILREGGESGGKAAKRSNASEGRKTKELRPNPF